ncbi:MAG: sarcosine oxidase subunit delta [Flavobacteriales bacterium]|nr:sarcosine oxidase subunit delta [Flavobacteriales bacterium]
MLTCPNCGKRNVGEFSYKGSYNKRPDAAASFDKWVDYVYMDENPTGMNREWWYHGNGCKRWFIVDRDSMDNLSHKSQWFSEV